MAPTFPHRFYLVGDNGEVTWTNNFEVAAAAKRDGSTIVIEPRVAEATFDGDVQPIVEAEPDDYIDPDDSDDDEGDDE